MSQKAELKALLARAGVELNNTLHRVDAMSDSEIADTAKSLGSVKQAFFDKNGSCGAASLKDLQAFFDKNGSCAARSSGLDAALNKALGH